MTAPNSLTVSTDLFGARPAAGAMKRSLSLLSETLTHDGHACAFCVRSESATGALRDATFILQHCRSEQEMRLDYADIEHLVEVLAGVLEHARS